MTTPTPTDLPEAPAIVKLLRDLQTRLGPRKPGTDEPEERQQWIDIDNACAALSAAAPAVAHHAEMAMIDAAMVEMQNIHPPLKRSECQRLIRAALAAPTTEQSSEVAGQQQRECCNEDCGWSGPASEAVHPKHDPSRLLCPRCHEVTEDAGAPTAPQAGAESYLPSDLLQAAQSAYELLSTRLGTPDCMYHVVTGLAAAIHDAAALRARGAVPSDATEHEDVVRARHIAAVARRWIGDRTHLGALVYLDDLAWALNVLAAIRPRASAAPQPPAALPGEQDAARAQMKAVASLAHCGGYLALSASEVLRHIRLISLKYWGKDLSEAQHIAVMRNAIDAAMAAAKGRTDGGEPA